MKTFATFLTILCALTCGTATFARPPGITHQTWGTADGGAPIVLYTLTNSHGLRTTITNFGGIVTSLWVPDRHGKLGDIVLGYDNLRQYELNINNPYFGALIGRYGNRIAKGRFVVDGKAYQLAKNNIPNNLHGGPVGFDRKVWTSAARMTPKGPSVILTLLSPDGDMGFPGNLKVRVVYTLTNDDSLEIQYTATTDKDTVVNLTHHSYFNLVGAGNGTILRQRMTINADRYTPIDATSIPLGPLAPVSGTPFDFRKPTAIGLRLTDVNAQLTNGRGIDHNFVIDRQRVGDLEFAARATDPDSGRILEVWTTQPGLQFYTGNYLNGSNVGKNHRVYIKHSGFCLEAQHYPDSPNEPRYPTTILKRGEIYRQTTIYRFSSPPRPSTIRSKR